MKIANSSHVVGLAAVLASSVASATPITYTETVIGSGTLGSQTFTDTLVTLTFFGDTENIEGAPGYFENTTGTGTIAIENLASGALTGAYVFVNQSFASSGVAGFATTAGSVLDTYADPFITYGLGTIDATTGPAFFRSDLSFTTNLGDFNLQSADVATFSAAMNISSVPVPPSLPLFATAILALGVGAAVRRQRPAGRTKSAATHPASGGQERLFHPGSQPLRPRVVVHEPDRLWP